MSDVQQSRLFSRAKARAEQYLHDRNKLRQLAREATATAGALGPDSPLASIWDDLNAMFRLVGQLCSGAYTRIPARSLLLLVAGLLYFVWPFDLAPDAIPIIGWVDDVTLLAFVIRSIKLDLDAFRQWERTSVHEVEPVSDAEQLVCLD